MDDILYFNENYVYDEDLERVGQYEDPETGEIHWVEPASFNDEKFIILGDSINLLGSDHQIDIDYSINYTQGEHFVVINASCSYDSICYKSKDVKVDLKAFCDEVAHLALADLNLIDSNIIKECKKRSYNDLAGILFNNGIILSAFEKTGLGFAIVEGEKVTTIESLFVNSDEDNNGIVVTLKDCVGVVDLKNMENVSIDFNTPDHIISFNDFIITSTNGSRIKTYTLKLNSNMTINKQTNKTIDYSRPTDEDEFILNRSQLLNQDNDDNDFLDDRFNDDDFFM